MDPYESSRKSRDEVGADDRLNMNSLVDKLFTFVNPKRNPSTFMTEDCTEIQDEYPCDTMSLSIRSGSSTSSSGRSIISVTKRPFQFRSTSTSSSSSGSHSSSTATSISTSSLSSGSPSTSASLMTNSSRLFGGYNNFVKQMNYPANLLNSPKSDQHHHQTDEFSAIFKPLRFTVLTKQMIKYKNSHAFRWPPFCKVPLHETTSNDSLKSRRPSRRLGELTMSELGYTYDTKDWKTFQQVAKQDLIKSIEGQVDRCNLTDLVIHIGSTMFKCHLWVLGCYTDYFRVCNQNDEVDITETKITPDAFFMVYEWMRFNNPILQRENCLPLFHAAFVLKVSGLVTQFWDIFLDTKVFNEDQAFVLYLEAGPSDQENIVTLREVMLSRVQRFFLTLVASNDFLKLSAAEVIELLKLDSICVNTEVEVFYAVVRWANHNWETRATQVEEIVKCCIRFCLMPMATLMTLSQSVECNEVKRVSTIPQVNAMVNNGLCYTSAEMHYGFYSKQFEDIMQRINLVEPKVRNWVFDADCKYHHCIHCPAVPDSVITYDMFSKYLETIQTFGQNHWYRLRMSNEMDGIRCCVPMKSHLFK